MMGTSNENPWHPDKTGLLEDAGDVGGDIQVGGAYEVRFVRDDKPGSLFTVQAFASGNIVMQEDETEGIEYGWDGQIQYLTCTDPEDPGGTETWSGIESLPGSVLVAEGIEEAEDAARREAEDWLANYAKYIRWDGEPFHN